MLSKTSRLAVTTVAGLTCLFVTDNWSSTGRSTLITQADARVGRPLTPGSVAGVNRRVNRRADRRGYYAAGGYYGGGGYYGAGVAAAAAAPVAAAAAAEPIEPAAGGFPSWAPSFVHDAVPVPPGTNAVVTDPATGRMCAISTSGYHWCWTP